jgi:hypothetical protein
MRRLLQHGINAPPSVWAPSIAAGTVLNDSLAGGIIPNVGDEADLNALVRRIHEDLRAQRMAEQRQWHFARGRHRLGTRAVVRVLLWTSIGIMLAAGTLWKMGLIS